MSKLRLIVANPNYSSWSVRAILTLELAQADYKLVDIGFKERADYKERILSFSGAGKVPILVDGPSTIHESLAIAEYVAELYPQAGLWPEDRSLRARGRALSCEMHAGFNALRRELPMNFRATGRAPSLSDAARDDIARIEEIWQASLSTSGTEFLLGPIGIVDCMFYPVASRLRTYSIEVSKAARAYMAALFSHPISKRIEELTAGTPAIEEYDARLVV